MTDDPIRDAFDLLEPEVEHPSTEFANELFNQLVKQTETSRGRREHRWGRMPTIPLPVRKAFIIAAAFAIGGAVLIPLLPLRDNGTIEDRTEQPGGTGGPTSLADGPCTASQLRASATMEGAAGSREGQIVFTNVSEGSCTLQGTPTSLFNVNGGRINGINFVSSPARWQAEGDPKPAGWPVVTLQPGDHASIRLRWSNWCAQGELSWDMSLASGGGVVPIDGIGQEPPPCNRPNEPSTIEIGPIEPGA